jgi:hypothetical protein
MTVLSHSGQTPIQILAGWNDIDIPRSLECRLGPKCAITFLSTICVTGTGGIKNKELCSFVDRRTAKPNCTFFDTASSPVTVLQHAFLGRGKHMVQMRLNATEASGAIVNWTVVYT